MNLFFFGNTLKKEMRCCEKNNKKDGKIFFYDIHYYTEKNCVSFAFCLLIANS